MSDSVRESGFTLIELLVTMVVLVIAVTIAVPSFQEVVRSNRVTTETNTLVSALQLARSEAAKRGAEVSLTATGADLASGYCVHEGGTANDCDDDAQRIRAYESLESDLSSAATRLIFNGMGELDSAAAVTIDVMPPSCPSGKVNSLRRIRVGLGGQVTVTRTDCP